MLHFRRPLEIIMLIAVTALTGVSAMGANSPSKWGDWNIELFGKPAWQEESGGLQIKVMSAPGGIFFRRTLDSAKAHKLNVSGQTDGEPINLRLRFDDQDPTWSSAPNGDASFDIEGVKELEILIYADRPFAYHLETLEIAKRDITGTSVSPKSTPKIELATLGDELTWMTDWQAALFNKPNWRVRKDHLILGTKVGSGGIFFRRTLPPEKLLIFRLEGSKLSGETVLRLRMGLADYSYISLTPGKNDVEFYTGPGGKFEALFFNDESFNFELKNIQLLDWAEIAKATSATPSLDASPAYDRAAFLPDGKTMNLELSKNGRASFVGLSGPSQGVIAVSGKGDFLERAAPLILRPYFNENELAKLRKLATLSPTARVSSADIKLAVRMAHALLHEIRRDIKNYDYDSVCSARSDEQRRDFFAAYQFGACSFTSWIASELLQRLGFEVHIVNIGHVTIFFRLGGGYVNLDTSYNIIAHFPERADIIKGRDWLFQKYRLADGSPLDNISVESYKGVTRVMDAPQGPSTPMVRSSLPGLPVKLGPAESFWLDYTGRDGGYVVASFLSNTGLTSWTRRVFPGRLGDVVLKLSMKPSIKKTDASSPHEINYRLLPSFTENLYGITGPIALSEAGRYTSELLLLSRSQSCAGRCSYTVFMRNDGMLDKRKSGTWEHYYRDNKDTVLKVSVLNDEGNVISKREIDAATDIILMEGLTKPGETPSRLVIDITQKLPLPTEFSSRLEGGKVALRAASEYTNFGGINEMFHEDGSPVLILGGRLQTKGALPYTPHGVQFAIPPGIVDAKVLHRFHISGLSFPFPDAFAQKNYGLTFSGSGGPIFVFGDEDHPQPFSVTANASRPAAKGQLGPVAYNLHLQDRLGRPINDACVKFEGLMDWIFPMVPIYAKDDARRDLPCAAYTNKRGVAAFVIDSDERRPNKALIWRPLMPGQKTPIALQIK